MNAALAHLQDYRVGTLGAWLLVGYAVFIGGAIGSFLNVVAYRLPLKMSLNRPGSRCPSCQRPIRWYHNVPVFGWLLLRGRCHDCGAPIAYRYPLVEFLVGSVSGLVLLTALLPVASDFGSEYSVDFVAIVVRLAVVYLLFCAALLEWDQNRLPLKLLAIGSLLLGVLLLVLATKASRLRAGHLSDLADGGIAALLLALLGWPLLIDRPNGRGVRDGLCRVSTVILVALGLGSVPATVVTIFAAAAMTFQGAVARLRPGAGQIGWSVWAAIAAIAWMIVVEPLAQTGSLLPRWEAMLHWDPHRVLLIGSALLAVLSIVGRLIRQGTFSNRA